MGQPTNAMETRRFLFRVRPQEIAYLRSTLESYDGMAVVSTVDPAEAVIEVRVAPDCEVPIFELLDHLVRMEGLELERISTPAGEEDQRPVDDPLSRETRG